jgi:hypothetical protein
MMKEMATQQISIKHTLQTLLGETSSSQNIHASQSLATTNSQGWIGEGSQYFYTLRKPKRDFLTFEGEEVHKWLYKYNQYFDMKVIPEFHKLKLAS